MNERDVPFPWLGALIALATFLTGLGFGIVLGWWLAK